MKYTLLIALSSFWFQQCTKQQKIVENNKLNVVNLEESAIQKVFSFSEKLGENSGIERIGNYFYTFNDSGGKNIIYKVDLEGHISQKIKLTNAKNNDWEDIAFDGTSLFVGDFGNNFGNRTDLTIYKIPFDKIGNEKTVEMKAELITFDYETRTNHSKQPYQHDFDCESMFIYNNTIHLLTKAWKTGVSMHFTLPTTSGNYTAKLIEKQFTNGVLTAADIKNKTVNAVQYTRDGVLTLWDFKIDEKGLLFNKPFKGYYLGKVKKWGQIEGLTLFENKLYISGEEVKSEDIPPTVYLIKK